MFDYVAAQKKKKLTKPSHKHSKCKRKKKRANKVLSSAIVSVSSHMATVSRSFFAEFVARTREWEGKRRITEWPPWMSLSRAYVFFFTSSSLRFRIHWICACVSGEAQKTEKMLFSISKFARCHFIDDDDKSVTKLMSRKKNVIFLLLRKQKRQKAKMSLLISKMELYSRAHTLFGESVGVGFQWNRIH